MRGVRRATRARFVTQETMAFSKLLVALALGAPQVSSMGMARPMCKETETFGASVTAGNTKDCECCIDYDYCDEIGIDGCIGYELLQFEIQAINEGPPACSPSGVPCITNPPCTAAQCRILVAGDG